MAAVWEVFLRPGVFLLLIASGVWHYRRVLPGIGLASVAWLTLCGMSGAMPGETEIAGLVGALLRFLLSRSASHRVTIAGFVSGVALARWLVPLAGENLHVPAGFLPALGLIAGLVGIDLARETLEKFLPWFRERFGIGKKPETENESA